MNKIKGIDCKEAILILEAIELNSQKKANLEEKDHIHKTLHSFTSVRVIFA